MIRGARLAAAVSVSPSSSTVLAASVRAAVKLRCALSTALWVAAGPLAAALMMSLSRSLINPAGCRIPS